MISKRGTNARPNRNSTQGYEVIDNIKAEVEKACPLTISYADINFGSCSQRGCCAGDYSLRTQVKRTLSSTDFPLHIIWFNLVRRALLANSIRP